MVNINWTDEASFWLKDIHDYIAQDNPKVGYTYENDANNEIRILLYGHYRIAYLIKDTETIDILGVFHGSLAIERYI